MVSCSKCISVREHKRQLLHKMKKNTLESLERGEDEKINQTDQTANTWKRKRTTTQIVQTTLIGEKAEAKCHCENICKTKEA